MTKPERMTNEISNPFLRIHEAEALSPNGAPARSGRRFSLSPGERAGVRGRTHRINGNVNLEMHFSDFELRHSFGFRHSSFVIFRPSSAPDLSPQSTCSLRPLQNFLRQAARL